MITNSQKECSLYLAPLQTAPLVLLGAKTTWYLQSHLTCDKLSHSCTGSAFLFASFEAVPEEKPLRVHRDKQQLYLQL